LIFLYTVIALILFVILLLCIKVVLTMEYDEVFLLEVKWLFLKFRLYPQKTKKEKEDKEANKDKHKDEKPKNKKNKTKRANPISEFYENQGFSGVVELIKRTANSINGLQNRFFKAVVIHELKIVARITGEDAAKTAINYGIVCSTVFPALGTICSSMRVKKHHIDISADFTGSEHTASFKAIFSVLPIKILNAGIIFALQFTFGVLLKLFLGSRNKQKSD
jgi:hypothetical protein